MRRTPFRSGNWAASNSALIDTKAEWSEIGASRDRLRVRASLWRLMKEGHIAAEQRFMQSNPDQRLLIGHYWVFQRKSSAL